MRGQATFHFALTSRLPAEATVRIFDQNGHLVRLLRHVVAGSTRWDGRDQWGSRLANGLYFWELEVSYTESGLTVEEAKVHRFRQRQKLVISR
jgi:flagellar hook assembly protein FlgD